MFILAKSKNRFFVLFVLDLREHLKRLTIPSFLQHSLYNFHSLLLSWLSYYLTGYLFVFVESVSSFWSLQAGIHKAPRITTSFIYTLFLGDLI